MYKDKFGESRNGSNKTNLSILSTSKKSIRAGYLTCKSAKKGGGNTKKGVQAVGGSDYLT